MLDFKVKLRFAVSPAEYWKIEKLETENFSYGKLNISKVSSLIFFAFNKCHKRATNETSENGDAAETIFIAISCSDVFSKIICNMQQLKLKETSFLHLICFERQHNVPPVSTQQQFSPEGFSVDEESWWEWWWCVLNHHQSGENSYCECLKLREYFFHFSSNFCILQYPSSLLKLYTTI